MTRGQEHAIKMEDDFSYKSYDPLLDKSFMVHPLYVVGAFDNPIESSEIINIFESPESDQSSRDTSSNTTMSQTIYIKPNKDMFHKESITGFPKGSNSYGDGALILGLKSRVQFKSKVGQHNYSTGPDAAKSGTATLSKLVKLTNGRFTGLYKTLASEEMILNSYRKIKSKPGNMTPGIDGSTIDGFSMEYINNLMTSLNNETFNFKPVKRTHIPKKNGKTRPLGIPSPNDKIIQESMRTLLEIIFEPLFLDTSHGFRPNRSCHTALKQTTTWNGYTWCIEGDIKGFFDNVDHHILERLLKKYIDDQQFIDLYWKLVKAGYVDKGISFDSNLGVPQGGIVSPILSNIYLHELDLYVKELIDSFSCKEKNISKVNPKIVKYSNLLTELNYQYQTSNDKDILKEIKKLRVERNKIPSRIRNGIRVNYVRYADDWIIGIIGNKEIATLIKDRIAKFLSQELKITLSPDKTKISHFSNDLIDFLGVYLTIPKPSESKVVLRNGKHGITYSRVNHVRMNYLLPKQRILKKLADEGFLKEYIPGGPIVTNAITKWIFLDHRSIIIKYNSVINGILNYYSFVDNYHELHLLINFILRHSCAKTLARKFRLGSRAGAFKKFGDRLMTKGEKPMKDIGLNIKDTYVKSKKFKIKVNYVDPLRVLSWNLETQTNIWDPCWICESTEGIEMHHVKHLRKNINPKQVGFTKLMSDLNRKQIPVCKSCHLKIHKGLYNGLALKDLKRPIESKIKKD